MLPGQKYSPDDLVRIALQRKWLILVPCFIGIAGSVLVARRVPELYRSETLIMVVPQRIPDSYVKSTDATRIEDRLHSISEQIQSRSRLERIITDFNLYPAERASGVMEDVVRRMRADINVRLEGQAQESFRDKHQLSVPLISDEKHEMLEAYGAWGEKSMYGRTFLGIIRTTVLVGADGRIARLWRNVKVDGHAAEVLAAAKAL